MAGRVAARLLKDDANLALITGTRLKFPLVHHRYKLTERVRDSTTYDGSPLFKKCPRTTEKKKQT